MRTGYVFFEEMASIAALTRDRSTSQALRHALTTEHLVIPVASWSRLEWVIRERSVTAAVIDGSALPKRDPAEALVSLARRYPSLGTVLVAAGTLDRGLLFRLGRAGLSDLVLLELDRLVRELPRAVHRSLSEATEAVVTRVVSPSLPRRELSGVRMALHAAELGWKTDQLAAELGLSRAHLSVRLRAWGLPSAGHLLTWAKLLHAGRWLTDPGRTAESVSRQLGYANGAVFRRALRNYLSLTPTELRTGGGLRLVLERFVEGCDLDVHPRAIRSVA